jgi:hypothetical protein
MRLAELLMGSRIARSLDIAAQRGIADLIGDSAKSAEELAAATGLPAQSLRRLLRALSYVGAFREDADGRFSNTDVSACLRSDASPSLREMSLVLNEEAVLNGWARLEQVLETGEPAFAAVNGRTFFEHLAADKQRSEAMARFMKGIYGPEGPRIAAGFDFGRFPKILDVGGGLGHILADILRAHPGIKGGVFDLARTADAARRFVSEQGLADRCEVFAGDFFESVTPGFDACFIKSTLHDWDDEQSVRILSNIRKALPTHGRVLITEIVLEPGKPIGHPHRLIDLEMMVTLGGRERTAKEFGQLLREAGLQMQGAHPIDGSFFTIVEGVVA